MRTARYWLVGAACGVVAVLLVVVLFVLPQTKVDQANKDRAATQVASCEQYNRQRIDAINSDVEVVQAVFAFLLSFARTQPPPGRLDALYAVVRKASTGGHPKRDCTPAGIAKYLRAP